MNNVSPYIFIDLTIEEKDIDFSPAPAQSPLAIGSPNNPAPPAALADAEVGNPAIMATRKEAAELYVCDMRKRMRQGFATTDDLIEAKRFRMSVQVAENTPAVLRQAPAVAAAEVAALLAAQFNAINARFDIINTRQLNMFARYPTDPIVPLPLLPVAVPGGPLPAVPPLPPQFPATRSDLFSLSTTGCNALIGYYGLQAPANATLAFRRRVIARHLGVLPIADTI